MRDAACFSGEGIGEGLGVGSDHHALRGVLLQAKDGVADGAHFAFAVAGGHGDHEALEGACGDGVKVLADVLQVWPVPGEGRRLLGEPIRERLLHASSRRIVKEGRDGLGLAETSEQGCHQLDISKRSSLA